PGCQLRATTDAGGLRCRRCCTSWSSLCSCGRWQRTRGRLRKSHRAGGPGPAGGGGGGNRGTGGVRERVKFIQVAPPPTPAVVTPPPVVQPPVIQPPPTPVVPPPELIKPPEPIPEAKPEAK